MFEPLADSCKRSEGQILNRRPSGYELEGQTLSSIDSVALIAMRPPEEMKEGRVLDLSWTLKEKKPD